ncbi:MAG: hypothetical protein ACXAE3_16345, partial [Candidatus Kariarchaeaceae archaeon]
MYQTVRRIRFHSTRFSTGVLIASFILAALSVIMATSFPTDEEFISEYLGIISEAGLDALFSTVNTDAPGWLFWLSLMMGVYIYYIFAVVGVRIGSGIFPTRDEDALELLAASNPQSKRKMYVETYLSGMIVLALLVLVSYGSLIIYSLLNDAADLIGRLGIIHLFYYLIAICMMSFASMMTVIRFSKSSGQKWGYGYLIFAFMLELGGSSPDMSPEALYMSVNSYLSPMEGLFTEEWNWEGFAVIAAITTFMFLVSLWRIKKPEYIERIKASKAKSRFGFLPKFSAEGKVARKYPVFFEELRVDRSLLITWLSFVLFFICYVVYLYAT